METETKCQAPFFDNPGEFVLEIGSMNYGRYNKEGYWMDYMSIDTNDNMFFATMKCAQLPERFRIVRRETREIVYGCGAR